MNCLTLDAHCCHLTNKGVYISKKAYINVPRFPLLRSPLRRCQTLLARAELSAPAYSVVPCQVLAGTAANRLAAISRRVSYCRDAGGTQPSRHFSPSTSIHPSSNRNLLLYCSDGLRQDAAPRMRPHALGHRPHTLMQF